MSNKRPNNNSDFWKKKPKIVIDENDDNCSSTDSEGSNNDNNITQDEIDYINDLLHKREEDKPLIIINKEIKTLDDLIELGKQYDDNYRYNIDMAQLNKLVDPLIELNKMVGMKTVKDDMVDHILFRLQKFDTSNQDMCHTVIQGPPGVGKTELARIIGKIYLAMGILKNNKFIKARRSELIGRYLGQTAPQTQKIIDKANGGILFIDEVYSLGNKEKRDSFAKECIDTINENLTEMKTDFICIIAGYKDEIKDCFFAYNAGLERRFPIRFTIEPYEPKEIFEIFKKKVNDAEWSTDDSITEKFFEENKDHWKYFGGDMEILLSRTKRAHSRRVFTGSDEEKKIITIKDLTKGFESFKNHRSEKDIKPESDSWKYIYM